MRDFVWPWDSSVKEAPLTQVVPDASEALVAKPRYVSRTTNSTANTVSNRFWRHQTIECSKPRSNLESRYTKRMENAWLIYLNCENMANGNHCMSAIFHTVFIMIQKASNAWFLRSLPILGVGLIGYLTIKPNQIQDKSDCTTTGPDHHIRNPHPKLPYYPKTNAGNSDPKD